MKNPDGTSCHIWLVIPDVNGFCSTLPEHNSFSVGIQWMSEERFFLDNVYWSCVSLQIYDSKKTPKNPEF